MTIARPQVEHTSMSDDEPRTFIPRPKPDADEQVPRRISNIRLTDVLAVLGAAASALCMTGLMWTSFSPFTGILGFIVVAWVLFIFIYAVLVSMDESGPAVRDRVSSVVVHSLGALVLLVLLDIIAFTFFKGWKALVHLNFFTQDLATTSPTDPLTKGGAIHAVVGTLIEVGIALAISVPLGLLGAVFLHQVPGRFSRFVRTIVEAMTALPDVLAGLFIYATLILTFGLGFSGFAAATALAVTVLPIIIRAADVVLRLVPGGLTEASYALGTTQWRTVWHVILPTARSGLATAVILGTARAVGETSPVLLTAGAATFFNVNPVNGPMMSLPLMAYLSVRAPVADERARGYGAAVVLLVLVLVLFAIGRAVGGRGAGQLSPRQARKRAAQSRRDFARYDARAAVPMSNEAPVSSAPVWQHTPVSAGEALDPSSEKSSEQGTDS